VRWKPSPEHICHDPSAARQIARVVGLPKGERPFRVHIDPMHDGAEEVFDLGDRIQTEFFQRIGFDDLLTSRSGRRAPN
jgi:hypothetical protein